MKKGLLFILLAAASVCLPAQEKENAAKSYRAVSYTHLDVYKRQSKLTLEESVNRLLELVLPKVKSIK